MKRPQLTAVNHYDVFPFNHGGSLGIRGLYKALSEWFDINIVTFVTTDVYHDEVMISPHVKVISVCIPEELARIQFADYERYGEKMEDSSPTVIESYPLFPEIIDRVREIAKDSVVVLAEHVYTWNIIKKACPDKHLWYRANNVEYDYKHDTWIKLGPPEDFLQEVYDVEKECCERSEQILTVSQLETDRFMSLYKLPESMRSKFLNIRSGFDTDRMEPVLPSKRTPCSDSYRFSGLFVASDTPVSRQAADCCIRAARALPEILFVLLGTIGYAYRDADLPPNVRLTGLVTDEEKAFYLSHCDFALNLLDGGAGINVKMFEYFAFGIPVITTVHGARGIEVTPDKDCVMTDTAEERYAADIQAFCERSVQARDEIARGALKLLEQKYSWRSIGHMIAKNVETMYEVPVAQSALPLEAIDLYTQTHSEPYLPKRPFYIRCAGDWGRKCLVSLRENGLEPVAFVEEDPKKIGKSIDGVPVVSTQQMLSEEKDCEVVVANALYGEDIIAELVQDGVKLEDISLAWGGLYLAQILDEKGGPYYLDATKRLRRIQKKIVKSF